MLRVVHFFDVKPGVEEKSFIEWLDSQLDQVTRRFGCVERTTWVFLDAFEGTYEKPRPVRRHKYLNEAFWPSEENANRFRAWLLSPEGRELNRRWFDSVINHTVCRYTDYALSPVVGED